MFSAPPRKVCNEIKSKESVPDFPYAGEGYSLIPRHIRAKNKTDNNILLLQNEIVRF